MMHISSAGLPIFSKRMVSSSLWLDIRRSRAGWGGGEVWSSWTDELLGACLELGFDFLRL